MPKNALSNYVNRSVNFSIFSADVNLYRNLSDIWRKLEIIFAICEWDKNQC